MTQDKSPETDAPPERKPEWVYSVGEDPDPRFSLANERTALAWVRTGLSLIAGGIALTSLAIAANLPKMLDMVALVACLAGGALAINSLRAWARSERALRLRKPLPAPGALRVLVFGVGALALILAGYAVYAAITR